MPIRVYEALCVVTVVITLAVMARSRSPRVLLAEYAALALSGFAGEETMITSGQMRGTSTGTSRSFASQASP